MTQHANPPPPSHEMMTWHLSVLTLFALRSVSSVKEDGADKNKLKDAHYPIRTET